MKRNLTSILLPHERITPLKTIGVGTFGSVFLAQDEEGDEVAVKKVCLNPKYKNRELSIVCKLKHPNCLRYRFHYTTKEGKNDETFLHLVTDFVPGTLTSFMHEFPFPPPIYLKVFGFQLFAGLAYLHHFGVAHRDIKPSNVLIDHKNGKLALCDFGSAKHLKSNEQSVSYIATRSYRAPELLLDCTVYTPAVDIWAAGCVLTEMLLQGRLLFPGHNNSEVMNTIAKTIGAPKSLDLSSYSHNKHYSYVGSKSGTLQDVLPRWTPPEFVDLLNKIFVYDPQKRLTAEQCMRHQFFVEVFAPDAKLPNQAGLPDYLMLIKTPEEMFKNFPTGPDTE